MKTAARGRPLFARSAGRAGPHRLAAFHFGALAAAAGAAGSLNLAPPLLAI